MLIHAGDWVDVALLEELETRRGGELVGVHGNNDTGPLRDRLPEVATTTIGGVSFAVVHETGPASGRERRMDAAFPGVDVLVFGHSHIPWDTVTPGGLRLLNPGSPTDRRRQPVETFMTATVAEGQLRDVRLVTVQPGWRRPSRR